MSYGGYGAPNYPSAPGYGSAHRGSYGAAPAVAGRGSYASGAGAPGAAPVYSRHSPAPGYTGGSMTGAAAAAPSYSRHSPASAYGAPAPNAYASAGFTRPRPPTTYIDPNVRSWFETVDRDRTGQINATELQMALVNGDYSNFDLDTTQMLIGIFDVDKTGTISIDEFAGVFKYINDWRNVFQHFDVDRSGTIEGHELAAALSQFGYRLTPFTLRVLEDKYGELCMSRPRLWLTFNAFPSHIFFFLCLSFAFLSNIFVFSLSNFFTSLINILLVGLFSYILWDFAHTGNPNYNRRVPYGAGMQGISFDRFVRCCVAVKTLSENFYRLDVNRSGYVNMDYEMFLQSALAAP
ncbi:Peflin [Wallemia ichthyophaga EXF-994]|uniref:Peflin n=2 Tax=Wallemia ichthyophaga TaxID=245174 RepID=R9AIL4_WALI9|nr:Peflin [Wallemia ichthyophaga EXF-994]EOR02049.1 Peflin [Wallemia ichthyophaga EXF-994]